MLGCQESSSVSDYPTPVADQAEANEVPCITGMTRKTAHPLRLTSTCCGRKQVATLRMHSTRYKHNNDRKHETEKRRPCDVIQESARTTVSQKNTVSRMMGHSNFMLSDFHSQTPEA
jgi:hypothetical protein